MGWELWSAILKNVYLLYLMLKILQIPKLKTPLYFLEVVPFAFLLAQTL